MATKKQTGLTLEELNKILWEQGRPKINEKDLVTPKVATSIADATFQVREKELTEEVVQEIKPSINKATIKPKSEEVKMSTGEEFIAGPPLKTTGTGEIPKYSFVPKRNIKGGKADESYTRVMQYIEHNANGKYAFKDIETGNNLTLDPNIADSIDGVVEPGGFVKVTFDRDKPTSVVPHEEIGVFKSLSMAKDQSIARMKKRFVSALNPSNITKSITYSIQKSIYDIPIIGSIIQQASEIRKQSKAEMEGLQEFLKEGKGKTEEQGKSRTRSQKVSNDESSIIFLLKKISNIVADIKDLFETEYNAAKRTGLDLTSPDIGKYPTVEKRGEQFKKKTEGSLGLGGIFGKIIGGLKLVGESISSIFGFFKKIGSFLMPSSITSFLLPVLAVAATAVISYKVGQWINEHVPWLKESKLGKGLYDMFHKEKGSKEQEDMGIIARPGESEESRLKRYQNFKAEQKAKLLNKSSATGSFENVGESGTGGTMPVGDSIVSSIASSSESEESPLSIIKSTSVDVNAPSSDVIQNLAKNVTNESSILNQRFSIPGSDLGSKLQTTFQNIREAKRKIDSEPIIIDKSSSSNIDKSTSQIRTIPSPRTTNSDYLLSECRY